MATLTAIQTGIGRGGLGAPLFFSGPRVAAIRTYTFDFDSSYPTGGESISGIFDDFTTVLHAWVGPRGSHLFEIDYTNKTLKAFSAIGTEVANTTNLATVTGVRITVIGYAK